MQVLIVEDNARMRQLIVDYVGHKFERIYECAEGSQAFALYAAHLPDWVLMDWQLEESDGITATRRIVDAFPDAHICMVTTFDSLDLRREAADAGAVGFVLKRNLNELDEVLKEGAGKGNYGRENRKRNY